MKKLLTIIYNAKYRTYNIVKNLLRKFLSSCFHSSNLLIFKYNLPIFRRLVVKLKNKNSSLLPIFHSSNLLIFKKAIAFLIIVCFFISSSFQNAAASISVPVPVLNFNQQQMFDDFGLTYHYGKITKAHFAGTDRVVINIQDLHCHPQVQKNISSIIEIFDKKYGVTNIYLEGAYGNISTKWLTQNLDKNKKNGILNKIIETGKLTGAEFYSAISGKTEIIKGLEKKIPYLDNLKRFGDILEKQDEIAQILKAIENRTQEIKKQYYTKRQYKIERLSKQYNEGKITPDKYYALLLKNMEKLGIDLKKYKNTFYYISLLKLQKKLNYKKIKKDLQNVLALMKQKISYEQYSTFLKETDNLKNTDKLCKYIKEISESYNINLNEFPNLNKYFNFIEIKQNINPLKLLKEEAQLTNEINTKFSDTKAQAEVVFFTYFEKYLKQYLTTKITPDDYIYYKENIQTYKMLWNKYVDNKLLSLLNDYLAEIDKFYEINLDRNNYFAENIFDGIKTNKLAQVKDGKTAIDKIINNMEQTKRIDVIVTGGFHSETVTDILEANDVSYIVITPNINGGVKQAEQTYYQTAKLQKEFNFQMLATLPFSAYGKNYQIAVAFEAFPEEAEEIFGKSECERIKKLIKKDNIKVKLEHINNIKQYRKKLQKDIDISGMLKADDIELKDLKAIVEKIGNFIFTDNVLSEQDLADTVKSIVELMNNKNSNLIVNFFDKLEYEMDIVLFKLLKSSKLNKRIQTQNVKNAIIKYMKLTNYDFYVVEEMFYYTTEIGDAELTKIVDIMLDKDKDNNYKNKNFIQDNICLVTAVCSSYKGEDFVKVLNLFAQKYISDKNFIINNPDKLKTIVNCKHSPEYLEKILNLFLEKDEQGNYKNKKFVEENKDFIVTICKAYKGEDVIKVLNLFFEKDEETKKFIKQFTQNLDSRQETANQNIIVLIEQQYPIEDLKEVLDKVLTKKDGVYIYEKFLKEIRSSLFGVFFTRYSVASKDMFMLILNYMNFAYSADIDINVEFGLSIGFFNSLKENRKVFLQEQKDKIIYALVDIFAKFSKVNNIMDKKIKDMRDLLLDNINPAEQADKQKVNLIAEILLDNFENLSSIIEETIIKSDPFFNLERFYDEIYEFMKFMIANYGSKNKNFITEPSQKQRFIKILAFYYLKLEKLFENYDEKDALDLFIEDIFALANRQEPIGVKERQLITEKFDMEMIEKALIENMLMLFNKRNLFTTKEQNIIFNNNIDKAEKIFSLISDMNDFHRLNDKVKKMFVEGYITTPATLKEYSIDTEEMKKNNIQTRKGKNPPLIRNKEIAKQRNCNNAGQVAKLFISFIADKKNNNEQNNKIFKKTTGFTIKEINNSFISGDIKNEGAGILYERPYDKFEILEIYADDIVYAIAQIMQNKDGNNTNNGFKTFLKENNINYEFKSPLFDGPCLVPYSEILNAGYDINDCTGSLSGGAHNVDFRNNRIYTKNHSLYGYYKNGRLVQKYGCDYDDKDFHIFSLEDIPGFRIDIVEGEYEYADSEGLFFFESMDFILEEKNRIEKEKGMEKELDVYIQTDNSNSTYLKSIAFSVTVEEYSDNYNLLSQGAPHNLQRLNPQINFKEKINEAKVITKRNRLIRMLTQYGYEFISGKTRLDQEKELAKNGTEEVKAEDTNVKFKTTNSGILNNFVKNFIKISNEYMPFYEVDKNVYAVPLNKSEGEFLEIKINEQSKINLDSRFNKLSKAEFDEMLSLTTQKISDEDMKKISEYIDVYKQNNIIFFNKNKLKKLDGKQRNQYLSKLFKDAEVKIENIVEKQDNLFLILKIKDGENNIYYAETPVKSNVKQNLSFELKTYDKNVANMQKISPDKKEGLINKMLSVSSDVEEQVNTELKKIEVIKIEVPAYDNDKAVIGFLNRIRDFIANGSIVYPAQTEQINSLIVNSGQQTPKLQKWAKDNNINLMALDIKYEAVKNEKDGEFLLQYGTGKIIRYKIQKNNNGVDVLTVFSKEKIIPEETDLINNVLRVEFPNAEFAVPEQNDNEIIADFETKYNITKTEKEIYKLVDDNSSISEIKENVSKPDLIKDLLSAA